MDNHIGHRIKLIRQVKQVSQLELARAIGIDNSRLSLIENGYVEPTSEQLDKIKAALNWPSDEAVEAAFALLQGETQ
jgi:transcriptional regulator with XRE-family HTH domain